MAKSTVAVILAILVIGSLAGYFFYNNYVQGTVVLSVTDPPQAPGGNAHPYDPTILHIYLTFTQVDVHMVGQGDQSGWTRMAPSQRIDLVSVLNVSRTIGTAKLSTGKYDSLRFNATTAQVVFSTVGTVNYSLPSGVLKVPITGGGFQITPGTTVNLQLALSFNNSEILAMNGHLTPVASAQVVSS